MPRNVVTVTPRRFVLSRRRRADAARVLVDSLGERYRVRLREEGGVEIDFPKRMGRRAAKAEVVAELERLDGRWRRLVVVYPRDRNLGDAE